jgi:hypothetical protein
MRTPSFDKPILLVHKSHQQYQRLPELLHTLDREVGGTVTLGASLNLPCQAASRARRYLDQFPASVLKLADPAVFRHADQLGEPAKKNDQKHFRYMTAPLPASPNRRWISELLHLQEDVGATALLTPTGVVDDADPEQQLTNALDWVRSTRQANPALPMFVNLTFSRYWLMNPRLRDRLLEELVESQERLWYLRFRWAVVKPPYSQQRNLDLLEGYRELARVARVEGKVLLLPTSGLTGWLGTAWGARGFGTGMGPAEQAFADRTTFRMPAGSRRPRRHRYFEPSLLHVVSLATHQSLIGSRDYLTCQCPFCEELDATNADLDPTTWARDASGLHYLFQSGRLLADLQAGDSQAEARKEVERAMKRLYRPAPSLGTTVLCTCQPGIGHCSSPPIMPEYMPDRSGTPTLQRH